MTFQGLLNAVATHISGGMPRDRHIVIVNQQLDVDMIGDGEASGFRIVSFLLGAIRP